ncbi:MAG TPA: protein kinase [Capsulimonadaceae bacterium]|jgi:serine/threonine protein kinase
MRCPICEADANTNDTICRSCGAALPERKEKSSPALLIGAKLSDGVFSIGRVLGKGGFGITYLGSDLHLRRSVAIKELFPSGCTRNENLLEPGPSWPQPKLDIAKDKFLNEARVLARFQHPNIVHVYTSFEENNTAYMVMEYLKGRTVQQLIREYKAIPEADAIDYIVQLADALRIIHGASYLHRDIKPGNILVADDGRVTLIDFGTAREFAADVIKQMTTMLTPGYAPLEQYTRAGKMGPFSDIYAMAATLYHMLTGQQPIPATDQANGAILTPPRQLNGSVSKHVSEAVMWSMQMEADQRPQTIDEFLAALEGHISGPTSRRRATRSISGFDDDNPYKERIEQILDELAAGIPAPPESEIDAAINRVSEMLADATSAPLSAFPVCPACQENTTVEVRGETPTKNCPICRKAELVIRDSDLKTCPVCSEGSLRVAHIDAATMFCPVCRKQPLVSEKRKRFGFATDEWWACKSCGTELNLVMGGRAKLAKVGSPDPFNVGRSRRDETLPLTQWRQIAGRRDKYLECNKCHAQLDEVEEKNLLVLAAFTADPFKVGQTLSRTPLPRHAWANVAAGLAPHAGNAACPSCHSEFEYNKDAQELKPTRLNTKEYAWSQRLLNKPISFRNWFLSEAGKRSLNPGCICTHCRTEFDYQEKLLKLMFTPQGPLSGKEGQVHSREGWHRIAAGLPTRSEETALRDKLTKLHIAKQEQHENYFKVEGEYQTQLKGELDDLIHDAFVAGHVPILLKDPTTFLLENETLYWESPAKRNQRTGLSGDRTWTFESKGVLLLTNQRLMFSHQGDVWQVALDEVERIEIEDTYTGSTVVLYVAGYTAPLGFEIPTSEFTVTTEFSNHTVRGGARDFVALVIAVRARETGDEPQAA